MIFFKSWRRNIVRWENSDLEPGVLVSKCHLLSPLRLDKPPYLPGHLHMDLHMTKRDNALFSNLPHSLVEKLKMENKIIHTKYPRKSWTIISSVAVISRSSAIPQFWQRTNPVFLVPTEILAIPPWNTITSALGYIFFRSQFCLSCVLLEQHICLSRKREGKGKILYIRILLTLLA